VAETLEFAASGPHHAACRNAFAGNQGASSVQSNLMTNFAYGMAFAGLGLWALLAAAAGLFGVEFAYPFSIVWVVAAVLPALGIALLFLIATAGREDEEAGS